MTSNILRYASSAVLGTMIALSLLGASQLIAPQLASAQAQPDPEPSEDFFPDDFSVTTIESDGSLTAAAGGLIDLFLGFLGIIAVVMILWGGFRWMTAGGNDDKVGEAKRILIAGVIGLAIILTAYLIVNFVLNEVSGVI